MPIDNIFKAGKYHVTQSHITVLHIVPITCIYKYLFYFVSMSITINAFNINQMKVGKFVKYIIIIRMSYYPCAYTTCFVRGLGI